MTDLAATVFAMPHRPYVPPTLSELVSKAATIKRRLNINAWQPSARMDLADNGKHWLVPRQPLLHRRAIDWFWRIVAALQ